MHRSVVAVAGGVFQPGSLEQPTEVVECYPAVELHERPLDDVLELEAIYGPRAIEREQMPPCFGSKAPPLMRPHHSKRGLCGNSFVHLALLVISESRRARLPSL